MRRVYKIDTRCGEFRAVIWRDRIDKVYLVKIPSLPGTSTFGISLAQAKQMAKDAVELYCDCALEDGKVIIDDTGRAIGKVPKSRLLVPA